MEDSIFEARKHEKEGKNILSEILYDVLPLVNKIEKEVFFHRKNASVTLKALNIALKEKNNMGNYLKNAYFMYEKSCTLLSTPDIEEILKFTKCPDKSVKLALFSYGILFDVLNKKEWFWSIDVNTIKNNGQNNNNINSNDNNNDDNNIDNIDNNNSNNGSNDN